jgi:drug/metabolite transporter (DMT)-like permease
MIKSLFRISVSVGLVGMALGIVMGIRQDFVLAPAHAHLNLLGFVTLFLSALYYRAYPRAAASRLAQYQAVVSVLGAILFPVGIACVLLGGHDRFEPVVVAGALTVFAGMLLFALIVYRTAGSGESTAAGRQP